MLLRLAERCPFGLSSWRSSSVRGCFSEIRFGWDAHAHCDSVHVHHPDWYDSGYHQPADRFEVSCDYRSRFFFRFVDLLIDKASLRN